MMDRLTTVYEQDFIESSPEELAAVRAHWDAWAEQAREELEAEFARQFREQGDDEETARIRAAWYVWKLERAAEIVMRYGYE